MLLSGHVTFGKYSRVFMFIFSAKKSKMTKIILKRYYLVNDCLKIEVLFSIKFRLLKPILTFWLSTSKYLSHNIRDIDSFSA